MTRGYHQHCPIAVALDELGDRWVLLILRELMLGPQRFTDLRHALPGIAPNLLSERLRTLEDAGLVARTVLEPPAARTVYVVTARGRNAGPVLDALARYGAGRLGPADDRPWLTAQRAARWFITAFHTPEPSEQPFRARVRVDGSPLDIVVVGRDVSVTSSSDERGGPRGGPGGRRSRRRPPR